MFYERPPKKKEEVPLFTELREQVNGTNLKAEEVLEFVEDAVRKRLIEKYHRFGKRIPNPDTARIEDPDVDREFWCWQWACYGIHETINDLVGGLF
jgi:hypothetical protein